MIGIKEETPALIAFTLGFQTGSLQCQTGACTELSIHAIRMDTFEQLDAYTSYIYPYTRKEINNRIPGRKIVRSKYETFEAQLMEYESKALEHAAMTMDLLYDVGIEIRTVAREVVDFIKRHTPPQIPKDMKPFLIGHNIGFNIGFLQQMLAYAGLSEELPKFLRGYNDFYGNFQPLGLDAIVLGQLAMCHLPDISNYKLETLCEQLDIELNDTHNVDENVIAATNIVSVLTSQLRDRSNNIIDNRLTIRAKEKTRKHFKI